jgi:hypothetical protein
MKKVRYVMGVAGLAPALGLAIPAAHAAPTAAKAQGNNAGKSVRLRAGRAGLADHDAGPLVNCGSGHQHSAGSSGAGKLFGYITFSGLCVHSQHASLNKAQTGLTERFRLYSGGGRLERTTWQAGKISDGETYFQSKPNSYALNVCEALVANSNHNDVKYGPICMKTS